jgi:hypothetical protein
MSRFVWSVKNGFHTLHPFMVVWVVVCVVAVIVFQERSKSNASVAANVSRPTLDKESAHCHPHRGL